MDISNQSYIVLVKSKRKHYLILIEVEINIFFDIDNVMDAKICPEIDIDPFIHETEQRLQSLQCF